MRALRGAGTVMALAATLASQAAWAENAIYEGDCARAKMVKDENTIDKVMRYSRYKGVQLARFGDSWEVTCDSDTMILHTMTLVSRSTTEAVYSFRRADVTIGNTPGTCRSTRISSDTVSGTVRFSTRLENRNGLCEVYIWSDWQSSNSADPNWKGRFANRIILLNDGSFAVAQNGPGGGKFYTPKTYSGVM